MALVAPGELADLRPPPRPGSLARSVSPWRLLDAPTLRASTPHGGQGNSTSRQSVGEALKELQNKFAAFSLQVTADVKVLQSEITVLRGQLQEEKDARIIQEKEVQKLQLALGEEKTKTECVSAELGRVRQELVDRCKALEEVQRSGQQVAEKLVLKVLVPEFCPTVPELQYSQGDRHCRYNGKDEQYYYAVAREGFTSGRQQFTVLVETKCLCIGVVVANAPRAAKWLHRQGVFLDCNGKVHTPEGDGRSYSTPAKSFKAGSRVTMRLNFDKRTASYEVDGVDLGVVEGLTLPEGPLYPTVVFWGIREGAAEFVHCTPTCPTSLASRA